MGMATRSGCRTQCLEVDMPCTGCGGAVPNQHEAGASMITALASILRPENESEYADKDIESLISQVGTFYMYAYPRPSLDAK